MNTNIYHIGVNGVGSWRRRGASAVLAGMFAVALSNTANAQMHGVAIGKVCDSPVCEAQPLNCSLVVGHADGYGDTIEILEAFDVVDPSGSATRVPAVGHLAISQVFVNTSCTVGGSLPCNIGAAFSLLDGLPGDEQPGTVVFLQDLYIVQPGDPDPLPNQANMRVRDLCDDPDTQGCSSIINLVQFVASTDTTDCNDGDACTVDMCDAGQCSYAPVVCNEADACTTGTCDPQLGCVYTPVVCSDGDPCTIDGCVVPTGCTFTPILCNDENACTTDACVDGLCVYEPIDCDGGNACIVATCDPAIGCVTTPINCDDSNVCTTDTCDPLTGCVHTQVDCDDADPCTRDVCTLASGCQHYDSGLCGACCDRSTYTCVDGVTAEDCICPACAFEAGETCETTACDGTIPTVSEWGLVVLALLLLTGAKLRFGVRQAVRA